MTKKDPVVIGLAVITMYTKIIITPAANRLWVQHLVEQKRFTGCCVHWCKSKYLLFRAISL